MIPMDHNDSSNKSRANLLTSKRGLPNGIPMLSGGGGGPATASVIAKRPKLLSSPKTPLNGTTKAANSNAYLSSSNKKRYTVLIRKPTNKKHKTWDMDGVLIVPVDKSVQAVLRSEDGSLLGRQFVDKIKAEPDQEFMVGEYQVCINDEDLEVSSRPSSGGSAALKSTPTPSSSLTMPMPTNSAVVSNPAVEKSTKVTGAISIDSSDDDDNDEVQVLSQARSRNVDQKRLPNQLTVEKRVNSTGCKFDVLLRKRNSKPNAPYPDDGRLSLRDGRATLRNTKGKILGEIDVANVRTDDKLTIGNKEVLVGDPVSKEDEEEEREITKKNPLNALPQPTILSTRTSKLPRYSSDRAIVLPRLRGVPKDETLDVSIDPHLATKLKPHQVEGVKFLYECVMGMRSSTKGGKGALLADEMGLGKTLMTIALIWTLLNQNPIKGERPVVKRALIACPVTLLQNWKAEFNRWLDTRVKVFVMDDKADIGIFKYSRCSVMLIGYDRLRILNENLKSCRFDLIVCDEAQKLKRVESQSTQSIINLGIDRKIMLSGTPIQNNLSEFYAMAEVLNSGLLGSASSFKRKFEDPIMKGREATAPAKLKQAAESKLQELTSITSGFVLRRTNELLADTLPSRTDTIVFCRPTKYQIGAYRELCNSSEVWRELDELSAVEDIREMELIEKRGNLGTMAKLKKICNSPVLLDDGYQNNNILQMTTHAFHSGKMVVLKALIQALKSKTKEKIVIVSQYTKTLDLIEQMIGQLGLNSTRLDGSTSTGTRHQLVDGFNNSGQEAIFAFLTSTRSGGAGINLIGASRLVLYDCDWNPSWDNQAMARIHRMGQKRPVFIYRLLTTGCIDECIFQRQITKQSLANQFMDATDGGGGNNEDSGSGSNSFTKDELRDIFTLRENTVSHTHDLLGCQCLGDNKLSVGSDNNANGGDTEDEDSLGGFTSAASVASDGIFVPRALRPETKMKGLLDYRHIVAEDSTSMNELNDDILHLAMCEKNSPVSLVMTKRNK